MDYKIYKTFGGISFTADIDADEKTLKSHKKRLAVLWALKNGVSLEASVLSEADLSCVDLSDQDLSYCIFTETNFTGADLSGSILRGAHLTWADFKESNLTGAIMCRTTICGTRFDGAIFEETQF